MKTPSARVPRLGISSRALLWVSSALVVGYGFSKLLRRAREQAAHALEKRQDTVLKETYPASDPPASQYFDIPVNRR